MKVTQPFVTDSIDRRSNPLICLACLILEKLRPLANDVHPAEVLPDDKCCIDQEIILEATVASVEFCDLVVGDVVESRL